ncbi:MAG TPA: class I SAM-dependent methyltransferase [Gemmatimonadaceae bacterium]|nr:class I SAM-dependent methyltransferase [Gemmatimonadaceae bacterium]
MTTPRIFDQYARDYSATVDDAIKASGENAEFFAACKVDIIRARLGASAPSKVLDFGCGVGLGTRALAEAFRGSTVVGFDPSEDSIAAATARCADLANTRFVGGDAPRLPMPDGSFDLVFAACVFHHIERADHLHWMREIGRLLRPGGSLFLFEHNPYNPLTRRVVATCPFDEGVQLLRPAYTHRMLQRARLAAVRPQYYFFFPHALRALRRFEPALRWLPLGGQYFVQAHRSGLRSRRQQAAA